MSSITRRIRKDQFVINNAKLPTELWKHIVSYVTCTRNSFLNLLLVSSETYDNVLLLSDLSLIYDLVLTSVCRGGTI